MTSERSRRTAWLLLSLLVAGCGSTSPQTSSVPETPAASSTSPAAGPTTTTAEATTTTDLAPARFTSEVYGYSVTVPAGWRSVQAVSPWDGKGDSSHSAPAADQWYSPGQSSAWLVAAASGRDLATFTKRLIAKNFAEHSATCPEKPAAQDPVTIGGTRGILLAWDCGILINIGVTVHHGVGYQFGFRDTSVHAATDPVDRAMFIDLLESVKLPD